jgi:hypothetical protein
VQQRPSQVSAQPTPAEVFVPSPTPIAVPASADDPIQKKVLQIVAEKTGYPEDMLDLDLDLEADLGVDTVSRQRCLRCPRRLQHSRDEHMKLRDFPTLAHVIKFAHDRSALVTSASAFRQGEIEANANAL